MHTVAHAFIIPLAKKGNMRDVNLIVYSHILHVVGEVTVMVI